jgi:hypothetical protein
MTPDQRLLLIGGYISSALYLSGCFVASLVAGHNGGWKLALLAQGFSCVSYAMQIAGALRELNIGIACISWGFGVIAGVVLLFGG